MKALPKAPMTIDVNAGVPTRSFTVTVAPGVELPNLDPRTWAEGQHHPLRISRRHSRPLRHLPQPVYNAPIPPPMTPARPPAQRLEGFRMQWPESQVVNKGRTSLDDLRANPTTPEMPQFGFNANFHFDQFPFFERDTFDIAPGRWPWCRPGIIPTQLSLGTPRGRSHMMGYCTSNRYSDAPHVAVA